MAWRAFILILMIGSGALGQPDVLGPAPTTAPGPGGAGDKGQEAVPSRGARRLAPRETVEASLGEAVADSGGGSMREVLSVGVPLLVVIAMILGAAWVVRRVAGGSGSIRASLGAGGRAPSGILEVLGRYPIGRGATLVLLRVDRRVLLVSQQSGGRPGGVAMSALAEFSDGEEVASLLLKSREQEGESLTQRFQSLLARGSAAESAEVIDITSGAGSRAPSGDARTQASRLLGVRA